MASQNLKQALEAAERGTLQWYESLRRNKNGYFCDEKVKFNAKLNEEILKYVTRTEYTPVIWTYGLNEQGKLQLAFMRASTNLDAKTVSVNGYEFKPGVKFQAADIISIRNAFAAGVRVTELAEIHKTTPQVISGIVRRKSYKWVK